MSTETPGAARPRRRVNFEVSVRRQRRWEVFGTYAATERDLALNDAKKIEKDSVDGTKVTKETFHFDTNRVETAVIYRSPALEKEMIEAAAARPEPKRPRAAPAPASTAAAPKPKKTAAPVTGKTGEKPQTQVVEDVSMIRAVPWILASLLISTLVGGAITVGTSYGLQYAVGNGVELTRQTQTGILVGVFLIVTGTALFAQLRRIIRRFSATKVTVTSAQAEDVDTVAAAPAAAPAQPGAQPPAPSGPLAVAAADAARFDTAVAASISSEFANLDAGQRFAVNVYLGGAMDHLAGAHDLDGAGFRELFAGSLARLGAASEIAERLPDLLEGYLGQPRVRTIYETGAAQMQAFLAGDTAANPAAALTDWETPAQTATDEDDVVAIMFTDIVDSTQMTNERGDAAAQDVIRTHNRIVRAALKATGGTEVKHVGDGIMASFAKPAAAVAAAVNIQTAVADHTEAAPDQRFDVRIGIDAGTVVHEDGDVFGATVQLASRLCDSGAAGEVLTSRVLRDLCGSKFEFRQLEDISLKGFPEPVAVCRVIPANGSQRAARAG